MQFKRAVKTKSLVAERATWESRCGRYRVMQSHIPLAYGVYKGGVHQGYRDTFYALHLAGRWDIISIHRKRQPAERACDAHQTEHS